MSTEKALIVGAAGQVGSCLMRAIGSAQCIPTSRRVSDPAWLQMDLAAIENGDDAERLLGRREVASIYCAGGMTHVDACEGQERLAMDVNCRGPAALAQVARRRGIPFLFYSTEYVFDGENGPYSEDDAAHPINVYGLSKWRGEQAVLATNPDALVVRTTVVYGYDHEQKNFLYGLEANLRAGKAMQVAADQFSTPTYNSDLAEVSKALIAANQHGVFNVVGPELLSRLELARTAATFLGLDASLVLPVSTRELQQKAPRPLRGGLRNAKLLAECPDVSLCPLDVGIFKWRESERLLRP